MSSAIPTTTIATTNAAHVAKNVFDNSTDFEGWNCGKITICGNHQICGGYKVKGTGSDITKTFMLPPGTYFIELNFIKIDSWFVALVGAILLGCMSKRIRGWYLLL